MDAMAKKDADIAMTTAELTNIESVKRMKSDQFTELIRKRLSEPEPLRGEHRFSVFIRIFENITSSDFRTEFHLALNELLLEADGKLRSRKMLSNKKYLDYLSYLFDLIGTFYATYNQKYTESKNGVHYRIEEILTHVCDPDGPLAKNKDIYLRALYALSEVEGPNIDWWEDIFKMRGGIFSAAAFGAISKKDPISSIELLPEFIKAENRYPDDVSVDEAIFTLFDSNPRITDKIIDKIVEVYKDKPSELEELREILEGLGIDSSKIPHMSDIDSKMERIRIIANELGIAITLSDLISEEDLSPRSWQDALQLSPFWRRRKAKPHVVHEDFERGCPFEEDENNAERDIERIKPWQLEQESHGKKPKTYH